MTTSTAPANGKKRAPPAAKTDRFGMTAADWVGLRAMTDDEIMTAARADPDAQPLSEEKLKRLRRVAYAKFTRQRLGLSQAAFARAFHIPLGTLRDWEQHRREPDRAARAYLEVIAREPEAVRRALAEARHSAKNLPGRPLRSGGVAA